ncbi:MAG: hypothetical protein ACPHCI_06340 [Solirubrobacterales bacterium]
MSTARFQSQFTDAQLLDAAIEVIESMSVAGIEKTQRRFDAHRAEAGVPDLPRADSICSRLKISWVKLCEMPDRNARGRAVAFGRRNVSESIAEWITDEQIGFAIRLAAHRHGSLTITAADYRRERDKLMKERCAEAVLPDEEQILGMVGSWPAALAIAGLPIDDALERELGRLVRVNAVLDRALEAHGTIPTLYELLAFVRANDLDLPDRINPYPAVVKQWRARRLAQGIATIEYEPRKYGRPDFSRRVIWEEPRRIRRGYWTEALAVDAVARFLESRAPGEPTTRKAYVDWSRGNRDAPSAAYLDRWFGGFSRVRRLAPMSR